jgi:hypothetical protein
LQVLYTILGSDLPPRHSPNQTLSNLDFLIQNENLTLPSCLSFPSLSPSFPNAHPIPKLNLKRHFILNRLQPSPSRTAILSLLASHSLPFSEIPFVDASYRSQPFRWDGLSSGGGRWGLGGSGVPDSFYTGHVAQEALRQSGGEEMREIEVGRAGWKELDWALHSKNLYAMHNNGGRNEALRMAFGEEGEEDIWDREGRRRRTRWAIPLDSNCAFTPAGAVGLVESIVQVEEERARMKAVADDGEQVEGENKKEEGKEYVVVPMARLLGNEEFFKWNSEPDWKVLDRLERGEEKRDREMDRLLEDRRPSGKLIIFPLHPRRPRTKVNLFPSPFCAQPPLNLRSPFAGRPLAGSPLLSATGAAPNSLFSGTWAGSLSPGPFTGLPTPGSSPTAPSPPPLSLRFATSPSSPLKRKGGPSGSSAGRAVSRQKMQRGWGDGQAGGLRGS